ncbi:MAG TPA: choice-of-anchor P family protein [Acidimicrobiales bacterium]|jgi:hypothetical protein
MGSRLILAGFLVGGTVLGTVTFGGGSGADTPFNAGTALASANALDVAPSLAQLSIAVQLGTAQASYEYNEAQALSQTLDLGVIGTILEAPNCSTGAPAAIQNKDFPQPVQAESTDGPQSLHAVASTALNGTGGAVGDENAAVTQTPTGTASTSIADDNLANLVTMAGATTAANASVQNGNERVANATADIASLSIAKGLVVLKGLHWTASQTSGVTSSSSATFSLGGLTVAGVNIPLPTSSVITTVLSIVNTALEAVGFEIEWPTMSTAPDGTVAISPLTVGIDNSALGQELVGAQLNTVQPIREAIFNQLFNLDCNLPGYTEVFDIGLGVAAGGGDLNLEFGGAHAVTNDQVATSPFGSAGSTPSGGGTVLALPPSTGTTPSLGTLGSTSLPSAPSVTPTSSTPTSSTSPKVALGPLSKTVSCQSLSTAGGGCSTTNVAVPIGLVGLGFLALLAAWDYMRQRRQRELAATTIRRIKGAAG